MPGDAEAAGTGIEQRVVEGIADRVLEDRYTDAEATGVGGGSAPGWPSPFPRYIDPQLVRVGKDHPLAAGLGVVARKPEFATLRMAVADLTSDVMHPAYTGVNDETLTEISSMGKLCLLIPSFALREAVRTATQLHETKDPPALFLELAKAWKKEIEQHFNKKGNDSLPRLDLVLSDHSANGKWPFKFDFPNTAADQLSQVGFRRHLRGALRLSDNDMAAHAIRRLGFPFIKGAMEAARLWGPKRFILNLDYGGQWWDGSNKSVAQAATARGVAELMTLVAQDRMVTPGLSPDIRTVMGSFREGSADPDIFDGLRGILTDAERATMDGLNKVGYLKPNGPFGDAAIIRHQSAKGLRLHYVVVILNATSHAVVQKAAQAIDDLIMLAHGELPIRPGR
jgi:hypothetical protein